MICRCMSKEESRGTERGKSKISQKGKKKKGGIEQKTKSKEQRAKTQEQAAETDMMRTGRIRALPHQDPRVYRLHDSRHHHQHWWCPHGRSRLHRRRVLACSLQRLSKRISRVLLCFCYCRLRLQFVLSRSCSRAEVLCVLTFFAAYAFESHYTLSKHQFYDMNTDSISAEQN